jgi:hypothetical protein
MFGILTVNENNLLVDPKLPTSGVGLGGFVCDGVTTGVGVVSEID